MTKVLAMFMLVVAVSFGGCMQVGTVVEHSPLPAEFETPAGRVLVELASSQKRMPGTPHDWVSAPPWRLRVLLSVPAIDPDRPCTVRFTGLTLSALGAEQAPIRFGDRETVVKTGVGQIDDRRRGGLVIDPVEPAPDRVDHQVEVDIMPVNGACEGIEPASVSVVLEDRDKTVPVSLWDYILRIT